MMAALYAFSRAVTPTAPAWAIVLEGVVLGCLVGWIASRRDALDAQRLRQVVEALTERNFESRARLSSQGQIGDLGRSLDALAERLSTGEKKKRSRKDRLRTILDAMAEAVMVTDSRGRHHAHERSPDRPGRLRRRGEDGDRGDPPSGFSSRDRRCAGGFLRLARDRDRRCRR